ncbi:hypothetical protein E2562_003566 [Oryza meyeriana var. granulata]|uniref:Uncharacterized protein n=1 Tax=Oryza meyeriana var. granulata TaxID=110450 RepID=A0A6G1CLQ4_9ORYZ|nr:hypothetical protein E2562_003566 [Oryza meyeriana var. granulata]
MAAVNDALGPMEQFGIKADIITYSHQHSTRDFVVRPNLRTIETFIWGYNEQKQPWKGDAVMEAEEQDKRI